MKNFFTSLRALLVFTVLTGLLYPALVSLVGRAFFKEQAGGSLLFKGGKPVGSSLLAQGFSDPKYFRPRPSAVKYDASSSGASNLALTATDLVKQVQERERQGAVADLRFASGSGLDPDISVEAARAQVTRVAAARKLSADEVAALRRLVDSLVQKRQLGFLGDPRVNVLLLNLELDERLKR